MDLTAEGILAFLGESKKKEKAAPVPAPRKVAMTAAERFNKERTGYRDWKPVAKVNVFRRQICYCCGEETVFLANQFYKLENQRAYATWLRHEDYDMRVADDLPEEFQYDPDQYVPACANCSGYNRYIESALFPNKTQKELPL